MDVKVTPPYDGEASALAALMCQSIAGLTAGEYNASQRLAWAQPDMAAWPGRLARQQVWVARCQDKPVGFVTLAAGGYVDLLYVSPDYARCGVGTRLLAELERAAQNEGCTRLVTEASLTAWPFFERMGFCVEQRQQVPCRGETLTNLRMEKKLEEG